MQNREVAMTILRAKLVAARARRTRGEAWPSCAASARPTSGARRFARTCCNPYHAWSKTTGPSVETANAYGVLEGDIDAFVWPYLQARARLAPAAASVAARRRHRRLLERPREDHDRARFGVRALRSAARSVVRARRRLRQRLDRRQPRVHYASATAAASDRRERRESRLSPRLAIARSRTTASPYVFLLNPDAELKDGALANIVAFMDAHPRCGIAGSRIYNYDGTIQESCGEFDTWAGAFLRSSAWGELPCCGAYANGAELRGWDYEGERRVDLAIGAALAIRRALLDEIGHFDERFFLYHEEVDFAKRAADAGWETWYVPSSEAVHEGMGSAQGPVQRRGAQADVRAASIGSSITAVRGTRRWSRRWSAATALRRRRCSRWSRVAAARAFRR